jgi:hypothetical protein
MLKLCEKLILERLKPIFEEIHLVPTHQFDFRKKSLDNKPGASFHRHHSKTLENKSVCCADFLDIAQAFDSV